MTGRNFTPFPVLKTPRLTLRQLSSGDDHEIFALRSSETVNKYLGRQPAKSIDDARNFINAITDSISRNDSIYWAITMIGGGKLIGTACLFNFSEDNSTAEIGYELLPGFQGNGFMQQAVSKVVQFAFQQLQVAELTACSHVNNQPSTKILEQLNFKEAGIIEENLALFRLSRNG